jgi:hypothetical protein
VVGEPFLLSINKYLVFDTSLQRSFYSSGEKTYSVFFDI